jgi:hypothetical protein
MRSTYFGVLFGVNFTILPASSIYALALAAFLRLRDRVAHTVGCDAAVRSHHTTSV